MATFKPFLHVERLDETKIDVANFLKGTIYCFSKLDGTNAVAWADENGVIHCGSRTRELAVDHDNARFMNWFTTDSSTEQLRDFLIQNPNLIVYGEWLNGVDGSKQAGTIKQYLDPGFWVIGMFDIDAGNYLYYDVYAMLLDGVYDKIDRPLVVFTNPTKEDIVNLLSDNHFNLPQDVSGEGVVCWNYDYRDKWDHFQVGKIVAAEYLERKGTSQKVKIPQIREGLEHDIVEAFVSSADCEKCKQKIIIAENLEEWQNTGKYIGMFLGMLYTDLITEEMLSIVRRFKNPKIDFAVLKNECFIKGRKYLGLM